jgi:DNA polymerase-3 subunit delta'
VTNFGDILGHDRPIKVLKRAFASGRLAHAYLFWGPDGIGKEMAARAAAKVLLCRDPGALAKAAPCGTCDACVKCEAGEHPDLHLVAPGERAISVDDVRALQGTLGLRAFESGFKIAIIRDAFRMSREGANALLKTVEEPPSGTFLFLLAHHRSQLLPTLVSRCQQLRFDPLPEETLAGWLAARGGMDDETSRRLAELAGGSPGAALAYGSAASEEMEEAARVADRLDTLGVSGRFELSERWSKDKEELAVRLDALERHLRRRAREGRGDPCELERLRRVRGWIDRNVNIQLALDVLFLVRDDDRWEETA